MVNGKTYRRGSVFGALLLIAIGGLFLYANMTPGFSAFPIIARYWPVLIIFWGLSKLTDYLVLRGTPEAGSAARVTGGDIVGLIFLIIIGTAFSQLVRHGMERPGVIRLGGEELACLFGSQYDFTEELNQELELPGSVLLRNLRGEVVVTPGSDNSLRIMARKTLCAPSGEKAKQLSARVLPMLEKTADGYDFRWDADEGATGLLQVNLQVVVPARAALHVANQGDVRVRGLQNGLTVECRRGDVRIESVQGAVRLEMGRGDALVADVSGDVEVTGRGGEVTLRNITGNTQLKGEYWGPIQFASIGGAVSFTSRRTNFSTPQLEGELTMSGDELTLRGAPGDITLLTENYEVDIDDLRGQLRLENRNGDVTVRAAVPPSKPIDIESRRGDIELVLPRESGFQVIANTRNGDIETDFEGLSVEERGGGDESLTGSAGDPRTSIRLNTSHGNITIRRTG